MAMSCGCGCIDFSVFFLGLFFVDTVYKVSMFFSWESFGFDISRIWNLWICHGFFNGIFFFKKNKELIGFYIKNLGHMEPLFLKGSNGNLNHLDHMGEYGIRLVQQLKNHPGRDGNFIVGVFYEDIEQ
jgi:hypothetical protein